MSAAVVRSFAGGLDRRAFSLVEAVIAVVIVAVMLVAALNAVGASGFGQYKVANALRARLLAQELMAEILQQQYREPETVPLFGPEPPDENADCRDNYDDVDDYHNWSASPPQNKDGSVIPNLAGWTRSVQVQRVEPTDLSQSAESDTGVKKITVTVSYGGLELATAVAVRTDCDAMSPSDE